jgi:PhnB protein
MNGPEPAGYTTVAPWIVSKDTGALLNFIHAAFGGEELGRVPLEDGSIGHAEMRVGGTVLLAFDQRPDWPHTPSFLRIFVEDVDATLERAVGAGAHVVTHPSTHAFGQRIGRVRDLFGNIWWISAVVEDVTPEEGRRRLSEPVYADAMREAQETLDRELSGREVQRAARSLHEGSKARLAPKHRARDPAIWSTPVWRFPCVSLG